MAYFPTFTIKINQNVGKYTVRLMDPMAQAQAMIPILRKFSLARLLDSWQTREGDLELQFGGYFNWMIPNHYIKNAWKQHHFHPFKTGCLELFRDVPCSQKKCQLPSWNFRLRNWCDRAQHFHQACWDVHVWWTSLNWLMVSRFRGLNPHEIQQNPSKP